MCEYALELTSHSVLHYLWSGSIKKFFSIDYVNIYFSKLIVKYLFSMFFSIDLEVGLPHITYIVIH